jgi:hypothetical protein
MRLLVGLLRYQIAAPYGLAFPNGLLDRRSARRAVELYRTFAAEYLTLNSEVPCFATSCEASPVKIHCYAGTEAALCHLSEHIRGNHRLPHSIPTSCWGCHSANDLLNQIQLVVPIPATGLPSPRFATSRNFAPAARIPFGFSRKSQYTYWEQLSLFSASLAPPRGVSPSLRADSPYCY